MIRGKIIIFLLLGLCLNFESKKFLSFLQASASLKDAFASHFKIGTSVSPNELNYGQDFIKQHFNSITPENEINKQVNQVVTMLTLKLHLEMELKPLFVFVNKIGYL